MEASIRRPPAAAMPRRESASLGPCRPLGPFTTRTTRTTRTAAARPAAPSLVERLGERRELRAVEFAVGVGVEREGVLGESLGRWATARAARPAGATLSAAGPPLPARPASGPALTFLARPAFPAARTRSRFGAAVGCIRRLGNGRCRGDHDRGQEGKAEHACE